MHNKSHNEFSYRVGMSETAVVFRDTEVIEAAQSILAAAAAPAATGEPALAVAPEATGKLGDQAAGNQTATTPKENFQNLLQQQPKLVGKVLQDALKAAFPFTKLTDREKQVALQTAGVVGGAVSSTIIPCLFDLTGPFTSVSDQNKFMRTALSAIRGSVVTSHFPILLKQSLGGKNISGPDMQTLSDTLVSPFLVVVGALIQQSYVRTLDSSSASNDGATAAGGATTLGGAVAKELDDFAVGGADLDTFGAEAGSWAYTPGFYRLPSSITIT